MILLVGDLKELKYVKDFVVETAEKVMEEKAKDRLQSWYDDRSAESCCYG